jgi:phosphorylcholine metabolism protein LicD
MCLKTFVFIGVPDSKVSITDSVNTDNTETGMLIDYC